MIGLAEIRDVVYGFVQLLDDQELEIINHPFFQRLRRIKQLALTDMVYPGASHTRFEHSLGVMQMATELFDSITQKQEAKNILYHDLRINEDGLKRAKKIVRLAALLHDVGHPPFSHAGESTMPSTPGNPGVKYTHENYSIAIIKKYFSSIIEDSPNYGISTEEVTALLGDTSAKPTKNLIWKDLISGQLDADRSDYLLRDSIHLGVSYGLYDKDRLINSITIGKDSEMDGSPRIAIEYGGWHTAESLIIARYQMFSQVYYHKTRRIFDYHLGKAVKSVLENMGLPNGTYPAPDKLDDYLDYDDWKMCGAIKAGLGGEHGKIILSRTPYHSIKESDDPPTEEDLREIDGLKDKYQKLDIPYWVDDHASNSWYKLGKDIPIRQRDGDEIAPLSTLSKIVRTMAAKSNIIRFYIPRGGNLNGTN